MKRHLPSSAIILTIILFIAACKFEQTASNESNKESYAKTLQKKLIEAKVGETIIIEEGIFEFERSLSLIDTPEITIEGAGKGKTILSFKNQIEGAEGILVKNVKGITLEGFTIRDSKGDAIKVQDCENVIMRDLEATWSNGKLSTNGAYGLYPVSSKNILLENCEASYAMDAGIYVGQSINVIVRDNYVHNNVAGLEIENTIMGEVYNNLAKDNTGGMLIFDMPDLPQANGDKIKFYNNTMDGNNGENFASKGMVVSTIPSGSGMVIMAHSNIEAYNNTITNHNTMGIAVNSWLFTERPYKSEDYEPYCHNISIHDNTITTGNGQVDTESDFGKLISAVTGGQPIDIITDGIFDPERIDKNGNAKDYCFKNNGKDIKFINLNAAKGSTPEAIVSNMNTDINAFYCALESFDTSEHDDWIEENK